uniref:F-box protein AT5G49610-like beta-propeller domain-containing protein n=1 Tax=Oryza punctata TaxID=4537 RepID=A0A0E0KP06_ORYPU
MEGEEESESWPQLPPPSPAIVVLSDEDLLGEILLRLESHDHLVAAAIVCKHWLHVASGKLFLRRFRVTHPPRLLGFCIDDGDVGRPQFKALPQHPGIAAAAAHRAKHRFFGAYSYLADYHRPSIADCRDGRFIVEAPDRARRRGINTPYRYTVLRPPHPRESVQLLPPPLPLPPSSTREHVVERVFLPEDGAGGDHRITLVYVLVVERRVTARVHVLESGGAWGAPTTAETQLPAPAEAPSCDESVENVLPPINGEVYVVTTSGHTLGLRMGRTSFSVVKLPDAARSSTNFRLSWSHGDDDDVTRGRLCLVHGDGTRLSVWHRKTTAMDGGAAVGWEMTNTFCVREACERIEWLPDGWWTGRVTVIAVGDNAEFALLDLEKVGIVIYIHMQWRTVKKVYERKVADAGGGDGRPPVRVFPLTTVWPPTFPALNKPEQNCFERSVDVSSPDGLVGAVVMSCHAGWSETSPSCARAGNDDDDAAGAGAVLPGSSWAGWFDHMAAMVAELAGWARQPRSPRSCRWSCV